jgi:hypothetical protein
MAPKSCAKVSGLAPQADTGDGNGLATEDADPGSMSGANDEFADFKL